MDENNKNPMSEETAAPVTAPKDYPVNHQKSQPIPDDIMCAVYAGPPVPPIQPTMVTYGGPQMMNMPYGIPAGAFAPVSSEKRFCTNCGQLAQPGDKFCRECGQKLTEEKKPD